MSPLKCVTGRANAGKTGVAYSYVREALREGRAPILLLPADPDVERAAREISKDFPLGVRIVTFEQHIRQAWEEFGDGRRIANSAHREMLLRQVADQIPEITSGMVRLAGRCVDKLAGQTGFAWRQAQPAQDETSSSLLLETLIEAYARQLESHSMIEQSEAAHVLARREDQAAGPIVAHRFTDLTASQEAYLVGRALRGADVVVTLTWEEGFAATQALDGLVDRLVEAGATLEKVEESDEFGSATELVAVSANLFGSSARIKSTGAVRLSTAQGPRAEAQRIAEEVGRVLADDELQPEQIAVVFRDPARHYSQLKQAFADAGVAADFDVRMPLRTGAYGHALVSLLSFAVSRERERLLAFLKSGYSGLDFDLAASLETRWRKTGESDARRLVRDIGRVSPDTQRIAEAAIVCAGKAVDGTSVASWRDLFLGVFRLAGTRSGLVLASDSERDARTFATALRTLGDLCDAQPISLKAGEMLAIIERLELPVGEVERPGRVQVVSVARVRSRRFEAVILGGLEAGEFPARFAEDMLPGGAVAHALEIFGGAGGDERSGSMYDRLFFYQTVTRARRRLVLSSCTTDSDGEPVQTSSLLEELLDLYRTADGITTLECTHRALAEMPDHGREATGERETLRTQAFLGEWQAPRVAAAVGRAHGTEECIELPESAAVLAARDVFSASEIEAYMACPYRWFRERVLRPDQVDRQFGAAEQGEFAHAVLATFYRLLPEATGAKRVTPSTLRRAEDVISEAYRRVEQLSPPVASLQERLERQETLRWIRRIVEEDAQILSGFEPTYVEWEFLEKPIDVGGFLLRGRIDRIDVDGERRAIVTDYKRSGGSTAADILNKGKVQLPLYLHAVSAGLGLDVVGGLFRGLRSPGTRGLLVAGAVDDLGITKTDVLTPEDFTALLERALMLAREAVAGIRAARIPCEPRSPKACTGCAVADCTFAGRS
ncbi:MAG: hypothetical protein HGA39_07625 [Coriobacteriia bacterium]|nr:hypothetical protein [Coriobacteriia bacterium]